MTQDDQKKPADEAQETQTPSEEEAAAAEGTAESGQEPAVEGGDELDAAALAEQVADLKDKLLRAMAETENIRRRAEKEKADATKFGITSFARDILSVGDNLRRAIESMDEAARAEVGDAARNLIEGVEMTERELLSVLERHQVKPIDPKGEKFDPNLHQAMYEVPGTGQPGGTVVEVVQTGYVIGERLLRPALVGVAKGEPANDGGNAKNEGSGGDAGGNGGQPPSPGDRIDTTA